MTPQATSASPSGITYPESDGLPIADSSKQLHWIFLLYGNLAAMFHVDKDVFVMGNQFWYPVEGNPDIRTTPDVYVAFGRPKGHRGSYKQWEEGGVPMTVVFEVMSPNATAADLIDKLAFFEKYGVEEYYVYDPEKITLEIYVREERVLVPRPVEGYVSPRLGIRFDLSGVEMVVYRPDGRRFQSFEEVAAEKQRAEEAARKAREDPNTVLQRLARMAELSRKARRQQATPEEVAELDALEEASLP